MNQVKFTCSLKDRFKTKFLTVKRQSGSRSLLERSLKHQKVISTRRCQCSRNQRWLTCCWSNWSSYQFTRSSRVRAFKGSPDSTHFILEIIVGESCIRHRTNLDFGWYSIIDIFMTRHWFKKKWFWSGQPLNISLRTQNFLRLKISTRTGNDVVNSVAGTFDGTAAMLDGMTADATTANIGDHVELRLHQKDGQTPFDAFSLVSFYDSYNMNHSLRK